VKKSVQNYFDLIFGKLYEIIFYLLAIKFDVQFFWGKYLGDYFG
jgi:hypothetical protein